MPAPANRYEISLEDIQYLRHGDKPFLARIYKPRGKRPFPVLSIFMAAPGRSVTGNSMRRSPNPWRSITTFDR
jgi:hypothetical protein